MKTASCLATAMCLLAVASNRRALLAQQAPCRVISAGAETDAPTGSVQNVGQTAVGVASNGLINIHSGAIPCLAQARCASSALPDLDADCDVDLEDYAKFTSCATGPAALVDPGCEGRDFDGDDDVDLADFSILQKCYGGADHAPAISCSGVRMDR